MSSHRLRSRVVVGLVILALAATGCRGSAGGENGTGKGDIKVGPGVTSKPCPKAVNKDNGCIYLGTVSDLTEGPFKALAVPITDAQKAFWSRVNTDGGIGGYDIDVTTYVKDNKYNPEVHAQVYREIKDKVLALAQTLGSPTTAAVIDDMKASNLVAAPASWTSGWAFEDVIVESGINYCLESMNSVDYAVEEFGVKSVMAVHYPGDYGGDGAAGAKIAAEKLGLKFTAVETPSGPDNQAGAIASIIKGKPDLVILTTGPTDAAVIVGTAGVQGYKGKYIGTSPTWNPGLLKSPAAPAFMAQYLQSTPWAPFGADTPGHKAMREALGSVPTPNDGYTAGWVWSYALRAALEKAVENKDLTREGLLKAVKQLDGVDYEGMLPDGSGNYAKGPNEGMVRVSSINKPDAAAETGLSPVKPFFTGPTAKAYKLDAPCYTKL